MDPSNSLALLADVCRTAGASRSLERFLQLLVRGSDEMSIAYYTLDHSDRGFRRVQSLGLKSYPLVISLELRTQIDVVSDDSLLSQDGIQEIVDSGSIPYLVRNSEGIVGLLLSDRPFPPDVEIDALLTGLVPITSLIFTDNLLAMMQQPINYRLPHSDFYQATTTLVHLASGMEYVALRELDDGVLRCVGLEGFGEVEDLSNFNLVVDRVPVFHDAVFSMEPVTVRDLGSTPRSEVGDLADHERLKDVASFVVIPIKVGEGVTGVLSLATGLVTKFSAQDLSAFLALANAVGVAMAIYRD